MDERDRRLDDEERNMSMLLGPSKEVDKLLGDDQNDEERKHASHDSNRTDNDEESSRRRERDRGSPALTPRERQERWPVG